jgi:uroporphyrinogen-III synthase
VGEQYNILVTRPRHQAESLCNLIEQQGWNAIRLPTLDIVAAKKEQIRHQFETMSQYQWLIFISVNAVNFAIKANNGKIDCFKNNSIAAVGKATGKALIAAGLLVDLVPETSFNTEGLLATKEMNDVKGKSCLIIRGEGGRESLADSLRARGAKIDYLEVYQRIQPQILDSTGLIMLQQEKLNAITISSGESLNNLLKMVGQGLHDELIAIPLIVISQRLKVLAEQIGFKQITVSEKAEDAAIIETLIKSIAELKK